MAQCTPANIPKKLEAFFQEQYAAITHNTNKLMLFACDQKIEHLNADFVPPIAHPDAQHPAHLFKIAQQGHIGAMAAHVGLISRYAPEYPGINFIAKLNGRTPLLPSNKYDPLSAPLYTVQDALTLRENGVAIRGIGLTCYLGGIYESQMLEFAAQSVMQAHAHGLIAILWIYLRGQSITDDQDINLLSGAAGIANALGADFVKLKPPKLKMPINPEQANNQTSTKEQNITSNFSNPSNLSNLKDSQSSQEYNYLEYINQIKTIVTAAGNTGVIFSGQELQTENTVLEVLRMQLQAGAAGCAIGRNIFQRSQHDAIAFTSALSKLIYEKNYNQQ